MNNDFSHPQRQSLIGILVMFADVVQKSLRALWPILIVWIFRFDKINPLYFWVGTIVVLLIIGSIAYLQYRNFTFHIDEENEEFVIHTGVFNKSRIAIPLNKIQQVNINQSLIQKIIGVHALEVDTAGSNKKEVSIRAISHGLALALKERLLDTDKRTGTVSENVRESDHKQAVSGFPFIQISLLSLLKTGITSNYARSFALLLAFTITMFQYIEDFVRASGMEKDPLDEYINTDVLLQFITTIVIAIIIVTLLINLVRTIVKYYGFKITRQQNALLLSYGLLNTKNTIIRPEKVQIVTVGRNYFQKKLNILDLKIKQAAASAIGDENKKHSAIEIPGCSRSEKDGLLNFLLGQVPERGVALKPSFRRLLMTVIKVLVIPIAIFFSVAYFAPVVMEYAVFVPVYIVLVGTLVYFGFRNYRLFVTDEFIVKQSGAWDVDSEYIAPHKIQTISMKQYFWQKSSDVGIVSLHTAGGSISFGLADYSRLKQYVNYWLYQVETTKKNWM